MSSNNQIDPGNNEPNMSEEEQAFLAGLGEDEGAAPAPASSDQPAATAAEPAQPDPAAEPAPAAPAVEGVDSPENAGQPPQQDELLAALPEEFRNRYVEQQSAIQNLQAELAKARNDHAAMAGKIAPLQRRLAELTREPATQPAPAGGSPSKPVVAPQTDEEIDALLSTPEFAEYAATFPEEAKALRSSMRKAVKAAEQIAEKRVNDALQRLEGRINPVLSKVEQTQLRDDLNQRIAQLEAVHPDWRQHSESEAFSSWFMGEYVPALPEDQQRLFLDQHYTTRALSQPKFAARVLTEYKRDRGIVTEAPTPDPEPQPQPTATPAAPAGNARLSMAAAPAVTAPPAATRVRLDQLPVEEQFLAGLNAPD